MEKYACVRTDNMSGTIMAKDLLSLRYNEDIENGNVLEIGGLEEGEREVREGKTPTASSELGKIALVASEEVVKDKSFAPVASFKNIKGDIIRGYRLTPGDIFSVTIEALNCASDYEVTVGTVIELMEGTKLNAVASATEGSTVVGEIIAIEDEGYVIEVNA